MQKKHVQAELVLPEYQLLLEAAAKENLTLKQAVREATVAWARARSRTRDPLLDIIGVAEGTRTASKDHDKIYEEDSD